jgi:serine/threonine protein kinase
MTNKILSENYIIEKELGSGSFGDVFLCYDKITKKYYACKVEEKGNNSRLLDEYKAYVRLNRKGFISGLPKIYNYIQTPKFNILVMELLGESLDKLFVKCNKKFNIETVLLLGIEIINLLEKMHNCGYLHRDIKPNNFMVGYKKKKNLYIMDLGLSKKYIINNRHIQYKSGKSLTGTARYASINVHMGFEPSRRDDLESVGYMLVYFLKGNLPWQGLKKSSTKDHIQLIGETKMCVNLNILCHQLHPCFKEYLNYCRDLGYDEKPDYDYLRNLFINASKELNLELKYQWIT